MKNKLFFLALIAMVLVGCSKDDGEESGGSLPSLPDPNDVCSAMDDSEFIRYCYDHFDLDKDLAVSPKEAALVRKIGDYQVNGKYDVRSVKGIEYFPNLVELDWASWHVADLDLSYNLGLTKFGDYAFYYGVITLKLPKTLEEVTPLTFDMCDDLTTIYCPAVEPPRMSYSWPGVELEVEDALSKIYVPKASAAKYQKAEGWKTCASKIVGYDF